LRSGSWPASPLDRAPLAGDTRRVARQFILRYT